MELYLKEFKDIDCELIDINSSKYINDAQIYRSMLSIDSKPILIKSPKLYIQKIEKHGDDFKNIYLELTQECDEFYTFLLNLDETIKKTLVQKSTDIFGFPLSSNNVNNLYKSTLNLPSTIKRCPQFVTSIDSVDDLNVFSKSNDKLQINSMHENNEVMILFSPTYIDFYKNKISLHMSLHTIKIHNQIPQISEYMFSDTELSDGIIGSDEN